MVSDMLSQVGRFLLPDDDDDDDDDGANGGQRSAPATQAKGKGKARDLSFGSEDSVWKEFPELTTEEFDAAEAEALRWDNARQRSKSGNAGTASTPAATAASTSAARAATDDDDDDDDDIVIVIPSVALPGQFFPLSPQLSQRLPRVETAPGHVAIPGYMVRTAQPSSSRRNVVVLVAEGERPPSNAQNNGSAATEVVENSGSGPASRRATYGWGLPVSFLFALVGWLLGWYVRV